MNSNVFGSYLGYLQCYPKITKLKKVFREDTKVFREGGNLTDIGKIVITNPIHKHQKMFNCGKSVIKYKL